MIGGVNMLEIGVDSRLVDLARKYSLHPLYLQQILVLRNQGLNNTEIAQKTGISRVTVNSYIEKVRTMEKEDLLRIIGLVLLMAAGAALLADLMKK